MKKVSFISILFLFVLVYISSARATLIVHTLSGSLSLLDISIGPDIKGWDESLFEMSMTIDSDATLDYNFGPDDTSGLARTGYSASASYFSIDNQAYTVNEALITYWIDTIDNGSGFYPDSIKYWMHLDLGSGTEGAYLTVGGFLPHDYLGQNVPIPVYTGQIAQSDFLDPIFGSFGVRYTDQEYDTIYSATIDNFESRPVPEAATMFLFGLGLLGLAGACRKKQ